jgi:hypothetical protein
MAGSGRAPARPVTGTAGRVSLVGVAARLVAICDLVIATARSMSIRAFAHRDYDAVVWNRHAA